MMSSPSLSAACPAAAPAGAQSVPDSMRDGLVRYGGILARATNGGMFWRCARDQQRATVRVLVEKVFGVLVPEAEALERVGFTADFSQCWLTNDLTADNTDGRVG